MLCCIGDLVEDVVVWPSAAPQWGTDTPAKVFRRRGGSAANVAVAAVSAGSPSRFVGQVGNDRLGAMLVAEMKAAGVEVAVATGGTTGSIVVLIDQSGERTMLPDRGAATELTTVPPGSLNGVTWLHVPAYSLVVEPLGSATRDALSTAQNHGIPISIDASSTGPLREYGVDGFLADMRSIAPDVFFCNVEEATLLGAEPYAPVPGAHLTIIKAGADPVVLVDKDATTTEVPVPPVANVADTTGAGDAFAAGYLAATLDQASPIAATEAANRLAASVLLRPGAGSASH